MFWGFYVLACDWSSMMCTAHPSGGSWSMMGIAVDALAKVAKSSAYDTKRNEQTKKSKLKIQKK